MEGKISFQDILFYPPQFMNTSYTYIKISRRKIFIVQSIYAVFSGIMQAHFPKRLT